MRDRPQIFAGLLIFVGLFTFPLWYAHAGKTSAAAPDIKLPAQEKQCVAPLNYMRNSHMQLLVELERRSGARRPTPIHGVYRQGLRQEPHPNLPYAMSYE